MISRRLQAVSLGKTSICARLEITPCMSIRYNYNNDMLQFLNEKCTCRTSERMRMGERREEELYSFIRLINDRNMSLIELWASTSESTDFLNAEQAISTAPLSAES